MMEEKVMLLAIVAASLSGSSLFCAAGDVGEIAFVRGRESISSVTKFTLNYNRCISRPLMAAGDLSLIFG